MAHSLKTGQERSFIGNEYSNMLFLEILSLVADCFDYHWLLFTEETYHQKNNIVPVRRYNRLIKILDKPPNGGHVTTLLQQLKYILSIQTNLDDLWKLRFSLQRTKHIDVFEN